MSHDGFKCLKCGWATPEYGVVVCQKCGYCFLYEYLDSIFRNLGVKVEIIETKDKRGQKKGSKEQGRF